MGKKTETTLIRSLVALALLMTLEARASDAGKLELSLAATITSDQSIVCKLAIRNPTRGDVDVSIPNKEPVFMVTVMDAGGNDLNQDAYPPIKRGKSLKPASGDQIRKLHLRPGQVLHFEATIRLPQTPEHPTKMSAGNYDVRARVVTLNYLRGQYETTIFESNDARIVVPE